MKKLFCLICLLLAYSAYAYPQKELNYSDPEWLIYDDTSFSSFSDQKNLKTIYLKIDRHEHKGRSLIVRSSQPYFLFFNGKLSGEYSDTLKLNLDSLKQIHFSTSLLIAIHQDKINPRDLITTIDYKKSTSTDDIVIKPSSFFRDFLIVAGLVMIIFFIVISRLNPKLTADYLSVARIFSMRDSDDTQANARLTSSINIQFLIFASLLLSYCLLIAFQRLPDDYLLPLYFKSSSFITTIGQWLRLSVIVLGIFFVKIFIIYSLTRLFGLWGLARVHFFNWVRIILFFFGVGSVALFTYCVWHGQNEGLFLLFLQVAAAVSIAWIIIVFLKLNGKSEHSMFHLFSYICATEIIPLLIIIKVLFQ